MILRENPALAKRVLEDALARFDAKERTPGLHVSDLIGCLRRSWYKRRGVFPPETLNQEQASILALGHGHHAVLQPPTYNELSFMLLLPNGETIHGTIDVYWPGHEVWGEVTEIKSTRYSSKKNAATDTPQYIEQLASYVLGTGNTSGRLFVWHMLGDYNEHREPILKAYDIEFGMAELDDWRHELAARADIVLGEELPGIIEENHYTYECKGCPYSYRLGGPCETGPGRSFAFFFASNAAVWMET